MVEALHWALQAGVFGDLDAFYLRVKSNSPFQVVMTEEFRATGAATKVSKGVWVPSTYDVAECQ